MRLGLTYQAGSPANPKIWSGTPYNIMKALEAKGVDVVPIDGHKKYKEKVGTPLFRIKKRFIDTEARKAWRRGMIGGAAQDIARQKGIQHLIHFGTLSLPVPELHPKINHYLYCDYTWNLYQKANPSVANTEYEQLERAAYAQVTHFFPISDYVRRDLIQHYGIPPERTTTVGTGRGKITPFEGDKSFEKPYLLFVAKVRPEDKGLPLLIEAFPLVRPHYPQLELVLIGRDEYAEQYGHIPGIQTPGFIPWDDLEALFHQASLFVMPAQREPWGIVYLEALASQTPIVGLRRNSLPEITEDGAFGFLIDEPDVTLLSNTIVNALSNPQRLAKMGYEGQKACLNKYSWAQAAERIINAIENE